MTSLYLTTKRLMLRPLAAEDIDMLLHTRTDPRVMKYVGPVQTPQQVTALMPERCRRGGDGCIGVWCITERTSGEKLGTAILLPLPIDLDNTDWSLLAGEGMPDGEIEVGYVLKQTAWGRGYATETCRRMLQFAFEETPLQEVVAVTYPENAASQRVLSKCGLTFTGNRRAYNQALPGFHIHKADWQKQPI